MKIIRASIIGFGSVGRGVAKTLLLKKEEIRKAGFEIKVIGIADSRSGIVDTDGLDLEEILKRKADTGRVSEENLSGIDIIENVDHELVIETTPSDIDTGGVGLENMRMAFSKGRDVVTSNKGPLALKFCELTDYAKENGSKFRYEATVGGAMPILNLVRETLAGNEIKSIQGILNGTCNYILSRMMEEKAPYEQMLAEAQELGIAETDPTYDVEGIDAASKLVIIANSVFGMDVNYHDVDVTGITKITPEALMLAHDEGYAVRLIGEVKEGTLKTSPRLVPLDHPLAVGGTRNVAYIQTDLSGDVTVSGLGAGSIETASAILSDIISLYRER
ncbi:homoserine dehydrogenase [Methanohalophilus levihalophilus]|uniref:homoserine dehydrogenase n=1 Tax=Methanohalophilus levihalophilus TaxID=1431282 RepID=UPI001AEB0E2A|nr:homoserine dehydrogenase [Methanohalophilus levihalophilus]MBP2030516.1 homoserine dehydrogenase [Methanohalophilus levihalophilus]